MVKISTTNSKLGLIPSVNLPPILSCRQNCPCYKDCYARHGHYTYNNVKEALTRNYNAYIEDPEQYFADIKKAINNGFVSYNYFRWHAAGDIVDERYLEGVVSVAEDLPNTQFLLFTKKPELINGYLASGNSIPENLHIVYSAWGKDFVPDNPYKLPVAYVRFGDDRDGVVPETAKPCSGDCMNCLLCWSIKNGESVVFKKH